MFNLFGKTVAGGAVGYGLTSDWGGAAAGAGMTAGGWGMLRKFGEHAGAAGYIGKGIGLAGRGATAATARVGAYASRYGPSAGVATRGGIYANRAHGLMTRGVGGMGAAGGFIGNNAATINSVGGVALATLGVYSASHIGSSVLRSNRGY